MKGNGACLPLCRSGTPRPSQVPGVRRVRRACAPVRAPVPAGCRHARIARGMPSRAASRPEYGRRMWGVGLLGVLGIYIAGVAWRTVWGAAPAGPVRFSVVAGVSVTIHLGFHAAATAAPTLDAVALVLAGWSSFGLWCLWLSRVPSVGFRPNEDDGGEGGGGGGGGPGPDDGPPADDGPPGGGGAVGGAGFERAFGTYAGRAARPDAEPELEPAAD